MNLLSLITRKPAAKLVSVQAWAEARYETPPARQTDWLVDRLELFSDA